MERLDGTDQNQQRSDSSVKVMVGCETIPRSRTEEESWMRGTPEIE